MADTRQTPVSSHEANALGSAQVLVAYTSRYGSTKGIAERIASRLRQRGHRVELHPADRVEHVDGFDAVVFGSAVFDQSWMPEGDEFVRRNREVLARLPVWLFSVGSFGDRKRLVGPLMKREPRGIGEVRKAIRPREYRVFAGVIGRDQWPLLSRLFYHAFGGRLGDNRDWPDIDAWADSIAHTLGTPAP
jgi:menaquinone-dependent protoporphyrinogen oxidase